MGGADHGHHRGIRSPYVGEDADLPGMVHAHFPDAKALRSITREDGEGKSDMVVEIAGGRIDASAPGEDGGEKILRRSFSVTAGDPDDEKPSEALR